MMHFASGAVTALLCITYVVVLQGAVALDVKNGDGVKQSYNRVYPNSTGSVNTSKETYDMPLVLYPVKTDQENSTGNETNGVGSWSRVPANAGTNDTIAVVPVERAVNSNNLRSQSYVSNEPSSNAGRPTDYNAFSTTNTDMPKNPAVSYSGPTVEQNSNQVSSPMLLNIPDEYLKSATVMPSPPVMPLSASNGFYGNSPGPMQSIGSSVPASAVNSGQGTTSYVGSQSPGSFQPYLTTSSGTVPTAPPFEGTYNYSPSYYGPPKYVSDMTSGVPTPQGNYLRGNVPPRKEWPKSELGINLRGRSASNEGESHLHLSLKCDNCDIYSDGNGMLGLGNNGNKESTYEIPIVDSRSEADATPGHHGHHHHHHHHHNHNKPKSDDEEAVNAEEGASASTAAGTDVYEEYSTDNATGDQYEKPDEETEATQETEDSTPPPKPPRGNYLKKKGGIVHYVKKLAKGHHGAGVHHKIKKNKETASSSEQGASFIEMEPMHSSEASPSTSASELEISAVSSTLDKKPDSSTGTDGVDCKRSENTGSKDGVSEERGGTNYIPPDDGTEDKKQPSNSLLEFTPKTAENDDCPSFSCTLRGITSTVKGWFTPEKQEQVHEEPADAPVEKIHKPEIEEVKEKKQKTFLGKIGSFFHNIGQRIKGLFQSIPPKSSPSFIEEESSNEETEKRSSAMKRLNGALSRLFSRFKRTSVHPKIGETEEMKENRIQKFNDDKLIRKIKKYDELLRNHRKLSFLDSSSGPADVENVKNPGAEPRMNNEASEPLTDLQYPYDHHNDADITGDAALGYTTYKNGDDNSSGNLRSASGLTDAGYSNADITEGAAVVSSEQSNMSHMGKVPLGKGNISNEASSDTVRASNKSSKPVKYVAEKMKKNKRAFLKFIDKITGIIERLFSNKTTPTYPYQSYKIGDDDISGDNAGTSAVNSEVVPLNDAKLPDEVEYDDAVKNMKLVNDLNRSVHDLVDGDLGARLQEYKVKPQNMLYYTNLRKMGDNISEKPLATKVETGSEAQQNADFNAINEEAVPDKSSVSSPNTQDSSSDSAPSSTYEPVLQDENLPPLDSTQQWDDHLAESSKSETVPLVTETTSTERSLNGSNVEGQGIITESNEVTPLERPKDDMEGNSDSISNSLNVSDKMEKAKPLQTIEVPGTKSREVEHYDSSVDLLPTKSGEGSVSISDFGSLPETTSNGTPDANLVSNNTDAFKDNEADTKKDYTGKGPSDDSDVWKIPITGDAEATNTGKVETGSDSIIKTEDVNNKTKISGDKTNEIGDIVKEIAKDELKDKIPNDNDSNAEGAAALKSLINSEKVFDVEDTMGRRHIKMHLKKLLRKFTDAH